MTAKENTGDSHLDWTCNGPECHFCRHTDAQTHATTAAVAQKKKTVISHDINPPQSPDIDLIEQICKILHGYVSQWCSPALQKHFWQGSHNVLTEQLLTLILRASGGTRHHASKRHTFIWCFDDSGGECSKILIWLRSSDCEGHVIWFTSFCTHQITKWPLVPCGWGDCHPWQNHRSVSSLDKGDYSEQLRIDLLWPFSLRGQVVPNHAGKMPPTARILSLQGSRLLL